MVDSLHSKYLLNLNSIVENLYHTKQAVGLKFVLILFLIVSLDIFTEGQEKIGRNRYTRTKRESGFKSI